MRTRAFDALRSHAVRVNTTGRRHDGRTAAPRRPNPPRHRGSAPFIEQRPRLAQSTSLSEKAPVSGADLRRAEEFTREPFVLEGDDAATALVAGTARRRALDAALEELAAGREEPSVEWRREFSLILGLERLLAQEEPKLEDGTVLSAHQVDALSGTLIALTAESQEAATRNGNGNGARPAARVEELPSGEVEIEGDEELTEEEEPLDWDAAEEAEEEAATAASPEDANAARRFWFEHATGAGKTVAALGFVEASRTGGVLILTHRRNLVDQFNGELADRGYKSRVRSPLLGRDTEPPATGPVTVETYQWFVRNAGKI